MHGVPGDQRPPRKRRASSVGLANARVKPKRGKTHDFSPEEISFISRLLASDWTKDDVAEYYFLREDMQVNKKTTKQVVAWLGSGNQVQLTRGEEGFRRIGMALLQQERDKAAEREARQREQDATHIQTDQELERTHALFNDSRKSLCGKVFVSIKANTLRVWWIKSKEMGPTKIEPVTPDSNFTCSKLTLQWKNVIKQDTLTTVVNSFAGTGWTTCPFERYLDLQEKISIKLPYRIIFPRTDTDLNLKKVESTHWRGFDFDIALEDQVLNQLGLERNEDGLI